MKIPRDMEITVKFIVMDAFDEDEVEKDYFSLEQYVQELVDENGIDDLVGDVDNFEIVNVKPLG
jgi:hypothetical protein